jgi:hypothetical protein
VHGHERRGARGAVAQADATACTAVVLDADGEEIVLFYEKYQPQRAKVACTGGGTGTVPMILPIKTVRATVKARRAAERPGA